MCGICQIYSKSAALILSVGNSQSLVYILRAGKGKVSQFQHITKRNSIIRLHANMIGNIIFVRMVV